MEIFNINVEIREMQRKMLGYLQQHWKLFLGGRVCFHDSWVAGYYRASNRYIENHAVFRLVVVGRWNYSNDQGSQHYQNVGI